MREHTKVIQIGQCKIGGGNPVAIQSMTNTKTGEAAILYVVPSRQWKQQKPFLK